MKKLFVFAILALIAAPVMADVKTVNLSVTVDSYTLFTVNGYDDIPFTDPTAASQSIIFTEVDEGVGAESAEIHFTVSSNCGGAILCELGDTAFDPEDPTDTSTAPSATNPDPFTLASGSPTSFVAGQANQAFSCTVNSTITLANDPGVFSNVLTITVTPSI